MIDTALSYITNDLDAYLKRRFQLSSTIAVLGSILDEDGSIPEENRNKVILSLVNLEVENNHPYASRSINTQYMAIQQNLPFQFNLDVMVSSLFTDYKEGLKLLSEALLFFQSKQLFNQQNSPGLSKNIDKITLETVKVNYSEMHNIWQALGAKYLPSVLLKFRMISFQGDQIQQIDSLITSIDNQVKPQS